MILEQFERLYIKISSIIKQFNDDYDKFTTATMFVGYDGPNPNFADPQYFNEQVQFYFELQDYCIKNNQLKIAHFMSKLKPYYRKSKIINFFKKYGSGSKVLYLKTMKEILERIIDYLKVSNFT